MTNPYERQPNRAFWKNAVAGGAAEAVAELWQPKFPIDAEDGIATFGSCFAQHFSRALQDRGYRWYNAERAPGCLSAENAVRFNYDVYSARTGNIYTAAALRQWVDWAFGGAAPDTVWSHDGRFYDPYRPAIEPNGFRSAEEMLASRDVTLRALQSLIRRADIFVFTLGLTEAWESIEDGTVYPMCPGTAAGTFDATKHRFVNYTADRVARDLRAAIEIIRSRNPALRVLLTVSPVPLTATATEQHVLLATTYSKSVLRTVATEVAAADAGIDYLPSYELITAPAYGGRFYAPNLRSVLPEGVATVMRMVFGAQERVFGTVDPPPALTPVATEPESEDQDDDLVCEEELLAAFAST